jgi:type IV pilus assembly protein PilN
MAEHDLNLSTRPFRAHRISNLLMACVLIFMVVLSVWQVYGFSRFSSMARDIRDTEQNARIEADVLGREAAELESLLDRPEATAKLNEIGFINNLIARRSFSWTRMFATLEDLVPDAVHLLNLRPDISSDGTIVLLLNVRGRSVNDISRFIEALEQSSVFEKVIVTVEEKIEPTPGADVDVTLSANYFPERNNP